MKCRYCGNTWDTAVQVKTCPFCGKNLYENIERYNRKRVVKGCRRLWIRNVA